MDTIAQTELEANFPTSDELFGPRPRAETYGPDYGIAAEFAEREAARLLVGALFDEPAPKPGRPRPEKIEKPEAERPARSEDQPDEFPLEPGFYSSLRALDAATPEKADDVMIGVRRRQVTLFVSATNAGKTTILLNHCLAGAGGRKWLPLLPDAPERPLKVIYFDAESTAFELQADTRQMLRSIGNRDQAFENFIPIVDAAIEGEPLCLTNVKHFDYVRRFLGHHRPDIAVFDTVGSLFSIYNENDNGEVTRKVIKPLKALAVAGNCAVIAVHHKGKRGENAAEEEEAYAGRGASAFGALSRSMFALTKEKLLGEGYVKLSRGKSKGGVNFDPVILRLDFARRTFEICGAAAPKPDTSYQQVVGVFNGQPLKRADVIKALPKLSKSTIDKYLKTAVDNGELTDLGRGKYQKPESCKSLAPYREKDFYNFPENDENTDDSLDFEDLSENDDYNFSDPVLSAIER